MDCVELYESINRLKQGQQLRSFYFKVKHVCRAGYAKGLKNRRIGNIGLFFIENLLKIPLHNVMLFSVF